MGVDAVNRGSARADVDFKVRKAMQADAAARILKWFPQMRHLQREVQTQRCVSLVGAKLDRERMRIQYAQGLMKP